MFTDEEKNIFRYRVNGQDRYGDPMAVWDRLVAAAVQADEELDVLLKKLRSDLEPEFHDGVRRLVPLLEAAFRVKALDEDTGEGVPREELLNLYYAFNEFQLAVKKNTDTSPDTSPSTDTPPAVSGPDPSATSASTDSTSTSPAPSG